MAPRRTARHILLDSMSEAQLQREVTQAVADRYGRFMHIRAAKVRADRTATPTSCAWPDLTIWFPHPPAGHPLTGLHLVELKAHGRKLERDQPEVFASITQAGEPVFVWEPRDLDDLIPRTLDQWSGRTWP